MATVTKNSVAVSSGQQPLDLPTRSTHSANNSVVAKDVTTENVFVPKGFRAKKKVRSQDPIIQDQSDKPIDVFHVCISQVRAQLRVVEPRPVLLKFEFDSYWHAETDVYSRDVYPVWRFSNKSIRRVGDSGPILGSDESLQCNRQAPATSSQPIPNFSSEARFVYETEFGYKLHRKFMIVRLAERSPHGDVEWGSAAIPLDSIARGCEHLSLSILATDGVTCYGTVYCSVTMTNVQKIRIHLTDLHLSEYPEVYTYDVKLICLDIGVRPFENGRDICTEKRSDAEPRFSAQPALFRDASLRELLISTAMGGPSLKIFFSVRRQVARDRTEEIGMGALPIRMLFAKVTEGWMDAPTKFKVPLSGLKGVVRGKVLLRNIPQFCQLAGTDLYNADDVIMPADVDLNSRKLLTWLKLPKSMECRRVVMASAVCTTGNDAASRPKQQNAGSATFERHCDGTEIRKPIIRIVKAETSHCRSSSVEPVSEEGSESSSSCAPKEILGAYTGELQVSLNAAHDKIAQTGDCCSHSREEGGSQFREQGSCTDMQKPCQYIAKSDQTEVAHMATSGTRQGRQRLGDNADWNSGILREMGVQGGKLKRAARMNDNVAEIRCDGDKSGKSFGSCGTADGTVEIGSAVLSQTSDDGFGGSGCGEDALGESGRCSTLNLNGDFEGQRGESDTDLIASGDKTLIHEAAERNGDESTTNVGAIDCPLEDGSRGESEEHNEEDWVAVHHGPSKQYYFVHRFTQESLWLPPDWARGEDECGYQYFIDHGSKRTQRAFPIVEARAYRESVYAG